ncbi:MAG: 30S ribosomal protein S6 [Roseitalea porphyridii]|jgi:small subunit ribosomal protein S6|uniref:Small ribosomal subunit protein bS6 n=1 Tax=Roseitalea porphyridii TaxID=1852022 RepID=A0A4P6V138_9HYPH|nr:30S ribosomal protein S6 [Roseitalea porphyridii]QBK30276.1 30S ribosomal protein S6 [Roseitalea porphyridii]
MPLYEHVFLARQDISSGQVDELVDQFKGIISEHGGSVDKVESWGLKSLQFRIKKNRKAHYTLLNVNAPAEAVHELERQQRIHEDVLRYMTVKVDELEEGPSAMMRRDERRDRDRGPRRDGGPRRDRGGQN